ncbi:MAG: hypothetical protein ACOCXH_03860 [Cyclobacteriaceae bacterium]
MEQNDQKLREYYETLVQNLQKGETYTIKLKNNPVIFTGIPMIPYKFENDDENKFVLKVLKPDKYKGVREMILDDIEILEKKVV